MAVREQYWGLREKVRELGLRDAWLGSKQARALDGLKRAEKKSRWNGRGVRRICLVKLCGVSGSICLLVCGLRI